MRSAIRPTCCGLCETVKIVHCFFNWMRSSSMTPAAFVSRELVGSSHKSTSRHERSMPGRCKGAASARRTGPGRSFPGGLSPLPIKKALLQRRLYFFRNDCFVAQAGQFQREGHIPGEWRSSAMGWAPGISFRPCGEEAAGANPPKTVRSSDRPAESGCLPPSGCRVRRPKDG